MTKIRQIGRSLLHGCKVLKELLLLDLLELGLIRNGVKSFPPQVDLLNVSNTKGRADYGRHSPFLIVGSSDMHRI